MIAKEMLFQVGMEEYEKRHLDELSGGQQQRVFLARALAEEAEVYLLDEPFKGVDAMTEKDILALLRKRRDRGETVIVVHHALQTVPEYFDRAVLINRRLVAEGPVKDVFTSENIEKTFFPAGEETPSWT